MKAIEQLHYIQRFHKKAHLAPGRAFMAGTLGGIPGAAAHGATAGNGKNEAGRAALYALLLGGAGAVGGGAAGVGVGRGLLKNYLREFTPAVGQVSREFVGDTPELRNLLKQYTGFVGGGA